MVAITPYCATQLPRRSWWRYLISYRKLNCTRRCILNQFAKGHKDQSVASPETVGAGPNHRVVCAASAGILTYISTGFSAPAPCGEQRLSNIHPTSENTPSIIKNAWAVSAIGSTHTTCEKLSERSFPCSELFLARFNARHANLFRSI